MELNDNLTFKHARHINFFFLLTFIFSFSLLILLLSFSLNLREQYLHNIMEPNKLEEWGVYLT